MKSAAKLVHALAHLPMTGEHAALVREAREYVDATRTLEKLGGTMSTENLMMCEFNKPEAAVPVVALHLHGQRFAAAVTQETEQAVRQTAMRIVASVNCHADETYHEIAQNDRLRVAFLQGVERGARAAAVKGADADLLALTVVNVVRMEIGAPTIAAL